MNITGRHLLSVAGSLWLSLISLGAVEVMPQVGSLPLSEPLGRSSEGLGLSTQMLADSLRLSPSAPHPLLRSMGRALPALAIGVGYNLYNHEVRHLRMAHVPAFHNRYDDYMQFAPLAAQIGMRLWGVEGSSHSLGQMALADVIATASMLAIVYATKTATGVLRPDGSSHNSFPSGHTAMAFTSATLLHQEYGARYPWLSVLSYTAASATGIGRILNNRHWIGDVVTGAALGYLSGKFGYWLSDVVYGRRPSYGAPYDGLIEGADISFYMPLRYGHSTDRFSQEGLTARHRTTQLGLGARWVYSPRGYFAEAELGADVHDWLLADAEAGKDVGLRARALSLRLGWGRALELLPRRLFVDAGGFVAFKAPQTLDEPIGYSLESRRGVGLGVSLSPRWQFAERMSLSLYGSYQYAPKSWRIVAGQRVMALSDPLWRVGSTLSLML